MTGHVPSGIHSVRKGRRSLLGAESALGNGRLRLRHLDEECLRAVHRGHGMTYGTCLGSRDGTLGFQHRQQLAPAPRDRKCLVGAKY